MKVGTGPIGHWRYRPLLILMIATVLLHPLVGESRAGQAILVLAHGAILAGGIVASGASRRMAAVCALLAAAVVLLTWMVVFVDTRELSAGLVAATLLLGVFTIWRTIHALAANPHADRDALSGAIFGYFLLIVVWAMFYHALEIRSPGSFKLTAGEDQFTELLYFSIVTVTTLGYGDVAPVSAFARIGAGLEAATGTLYLAILIARIVGALASRRE